jgi:coenzyme F420-reducing hydrogenase beta subunit
MQLSSTGLYQPVDSGRCLERCRLCTYSCPFIDHADNENTLAKALFAEEAEIRHTPETGYYRNAYVGSVCEDSFHAGGASGGMATWFLSQMLEQKQVDRVICVLPHPESSRLFQFEVLDAPEQVRGGSGSCYYPVELSQVLRFVLQNPARYGIIALPCVLKALRLAAKHNKKLQERLTFCAGLVCGQLKTAGFAEYLIRKMELDPSEVQRIQFRKKPQSGSAYNYRIEVQTASQTRIVPAEQFYHAAWSSGEFKPRSCDFCDDVFAELAEVVFMDAWLPEYTSDLSGTNLVLTRSHRADELIQQGIDRRQLDIEPISIDRVIQSQQGALHQKRNLLAHRLWLAAESDQPTPTKRVLPIEPSPALRAMLEAAERVRTTSHQALLHQKKHPSPTLTIYEAEMKEPLERLADVKRKLQ